MHDGAVANGDEFADGGRIIGVEMNNGVVLNVGARADDDAVDVAAQDRAAPHTRFFFERDVADDGRTGHNPGGGVNSRTFS